MFNTSYFNATGALETSRFEIAKQYLRGWFLTKLLSSIPLSLVFVDNLGM